MFFFFTWDLDLRIFFLKILLSNIWHCENFSKYVSSAHVHTLFFLYLSEWIPGIKSKSLFIFIIPNASIIRIMFLFKNATFLQFLFAGPYILKVYQVLILRYFYQTNQPCLWESNYIFWSLLLLNMVCWLIQCGWYVWWILEHCNIF